MRRVSVGYNLLLVACILGVALIFNREITWWAWVGAFALFFAEAELLSHYLGGKSSEKQRQDSRRLLAVSSGFAVLLLALLGLFSLAGVA